MSEVGDVLKRLVKVPKYGDKGLGEAGDMANEPPCKFGDEVDARNCSRMSFIYRLLSLLQC